VERKTAARIWRAPQHAATSDPSPCETWRFCPISGSWIR
jgi:hypothetical protein